MSDKTYCPQCGKDLYDYLPDPESGEVTVECPKCDYACNVDELIGEDDDYAYTI